MKGSAGAGLVPVARPALPGGVIDTHVYLSRWPFRRIPHDSTPELVALLRKHGVTQAWAGSFDAVLHKNLHRSNAMLAQECQEHGRGFLLPFGGVNPKLTDWEEDVRRCQDELKMPGIRLHPNYHNYTLADPAVARLFQVAAERALIVQIVCWMEDERHHNPLMQVPNVDLAPLPALLAKAPRLRLTVHNGVYTVSRMQPLLKALRASGRIAFDFGMLDALMELRFLIDAAGADHVVLGSYAPMFYFDAAELKMREAALSETETRAVARENASRLLA
jgi:predicted TIM-barrel fold metal-dependent hydrolase